ncbi:putative transcription factor interactor and regulator CCHC(Zn) family [Helianthus annuus]|nr:putative transcription factor interactor and regulator CCHC(Zn) family [Helianthus annuus]
MSFLASILVSYEGLIVGKIGNPNMTKEDYDQVDPEEMELMDIHWCMASVIRRAQRFMEITGRKCLEGPDMMIGFDKNKVTCFKCKQKEHFKRECSNNKADDSVNPFHEDYYKKAIYHQNNEQPTREQLDEGSSKEKHVVLTIRDHSESSIHLNEKFNWDDYIKVDENFNSCIIHDDEGYDWSKHDKENGKVKAMVAEIKQSREERHAHMKLDDVYDAYKEATRAGRWSQEKECFVDPQGNPAVDPDKVDFEALVAAIPIVGFWCKGLEEIPRYREKVDEGIKKVIYSSLEKKKKKKKKTIEEIVDESEKLVKEVKKADEKAEEAVAEKQ